MTFNLIIEKELLPDTTILLISYIDEMYNVKIDLKYDKIIFITTTQANTQTESETNTHTQTDKQEVNFDNYEDIKNKILTTNTIQTINIVIEKNPRDINLKHTTSQLKNIDKACNEEEFFTKRIQVDSSLNSDSGLMESVYFQQTDFELEAFKAVFSMLSKVSSNGHNKDNDKQILKELEDEIRAKSYYTTFILIKKQIQENDADRASLRYRITN